MNKTELVAAIAEKAGMTKKDSEIALAATLDVITDALKKGESVQLIGFGTFEVKKRPERQGINPSTKEKITIAASKAPSLKFSKVVKDAIK